MMRRGSLLVAAVVLVLGACSSVPTWTPGPPVSAVDEGDGLRLTLELDRDTWRPGETIAGRLRLEATGEAVVVGGPGDGVTGFEIVEQGGPARSLVAHQAMCVDHAIGPDRPVVEDVWAGGWTGAELPFGGPPRLPAGEWAITAVAAFGPPGSCGGLAPLRATVAVHVTD